MLFNVQPYYFFGSLIYHTRSCLPHGSCCTARCQSLITNWLPKLLSSPSLSDGGVGWGQLPPSACRIQYPGSYWTSILCSHWILKWPASAPPCSEQKSFVPASRRTKNFQHNWFSTRCWITSSCLSTDNAMANPYRDTALLFSSRRHTRSDRDGRCLTGSLVGRRQAFTCLNDFLVLSVQHTRANPQTQNLPGKACRPAVSWLLVFVNILHTALRHSNLLTPSRHHLPIH